MTETSSLLECIASRASTLYSRPTVAMEIVQLADQPQGDAQAIKECIELDPALTGKILRVVNSSLYGLPSPVGDLNQAVALLGIQPLKLLVLGFNLPDALFVEVAARQLQWYWTNSLTRAVAARLISEQLWNQPGDEAFVAGLLQDIGILVLVREFGRPYTNFLAGVIAEKCHLAALERDIIRFDHLQLTAALLTQWRLPRRLIEAISARRQIGHFAESAPAESELPQILHLADLIVQLVAERRLHVLTELMQAGEAYRNLTKQDLMELVQQLQPQVEQLADVLSLELSCDHDYIRTLVEAHERLGLLAEQFAKAADPPMTDEVAHATLLQQSRELTDAMQSYLQCSHEGERENEAAGDWELQHAAHVPLDERTPAATSGRVKPSSQLFRKLQLAGSRCRARRQELSLLLLEPSISAAEADHRVEYFNRRVRRAIGRACTALQQEPAMLVALTPRSMAIILNNCERRAAVAIAKHAIAQLAPSDAAIKQRLVDTPLVLSAGVATASSVPRNFDPTHLLESAERCLHAARVCGISSVKSIEV